MFSQIRSASFYEAAWHSFVWGWQSCNKLGYLPGPSSTFLIQADLVLRVRAIDLCL